MLWQERLLQYLCNICRIYLFQLDIVIRVTLFINCRTKEKGIRKLGFFLQKFFFYRFFGFLVFNLQMLGTKLRSTSTMKRKVQ